MFLIRHQEKRKTLYCLCGEKNFQIFFYVFQNIVNIFCFLISCKCDDFPDKLGKFVIKFSQISNQYYLYIKRLNKWFEVLKLCICWLSDRFVEIFVLYQIIVFFGFCFKMYMQFDLSQNLKPLEVSNFFG